MESGVPTAFELIEVSIGGYVGRKQFRRAVLSA